MISKLGPLSDAVIDLTHPFITDKRLEHFFLPASMCPPVFLAK